MSKWLIGLLVLILLVAGSGPAMVGAGSQDRAQPLLAAPIPAHLSPDVIAQRESASGGSALTFMALGSVDLFVTDPQGNHVGVDPATGEVTKTIAGAFYYGPHETYEGTEIELVSIYGPLEGSYTLLVIGTGEGWFDLTGVNSLPPSGEMLLHDARGTLPGLEVEYIIAGRPRPLAERDIVYALPVMRGVGEWTSVLRLQNPAETQGRVRMILQDGAGQVKIDASTEGELAPQAGWPIALTETSSLAVGFWGSVLAENIGEPITTLAMTAEAADGRLISSEGIAHSAATLYVPYLPNGDLLGVLYALNASDEDATVRVSCYDLAGALVPSASVTLTVSPRATLRSTLQSGLPEGFQGSAVLESLEGQPLVGAVFLGDLAGRAALYSVADRPSAVLFVPQVFKGSAGLTTTLRVQNTTATATTVVVRYYDAAGQPFAAAETRLTLPPHGAAQVVVGESSALPAGFSGAAVLQRLDGAPLTAVALVQGGPGSDTLGATSIPYGGSPTLALPYLDTAGQMAAVQVQNLGSEATTVTLRCYDPAGTPAYTATAAVAPYGYAAFVTATLPLTPGVYAAVLESSNDQPLAAFVRQQGITEGLSLSGGAAAGPFVVPPVSFAAAPAATRTASFSVTLTTNAPPAEIVSTTLWVRIPLTTTWAASGLVLTTTSGAFAYTPTAGDGTYYFAAVAGDAAGTLEAEPAGAGDSATLYDTTAPSSLATAPAYANGVAITVTFAAADAGSGVAETALWVRPPLTTTWTATALVLTGTSGAFVYTPTAGDGPYYLATRSIDQLGNGEAEPTGAGDTVTIYDRAAPLSTAAAPAYANVVPITVTFVASDTLSGLASTELWARTPPTTTWGATGLVLTGTGGAFVYTPTAGDGAYYFGTVAMDRAGNREATPQGSGDTVTLYDTVPPSSEVAALPAYRMGSFTVTWSGGDETSGIGSYDVRYRYDSEPWVEWFSQTTAMQAAFSGGKEGSTYYYVCRAYDHAGNAEEWPEDPDYDTSTIVDLTPPASSATAPDYDTGGAIPVSWTAADELAGVAGAELWVRTPPTMTWAPSGLVLPGASGTFAYTPTAGDGPYYFATRAQDNAGNWEAAPTGAGDDSTVYDITPPSSQVAALPTYSLAIFTVTWSGSDGTSGLLDYDVQVCTVDCLSGWSDWLTHTTATAHAFSGSHGVTYSFRSRARDIAGNVEPWAGSADAATTVDTQPPETAVDTMPAYYTTTAFPVSWQGTDALSGLHHYNLYYRAESAANWTLWLQNVTYTETTFSGARGYTYHFCSQGVDNLGNAEICPLSVAGWPIQSDAHTGVTPWSRVNDLPAETSGNTIHVTWSGAPGMQVVYDVQVRDGFYGLWMPWKSGVTYTAADYTGQQGHIYCFRSRQRAGGIWELYPLNQDTYTKLIDLGLGGPVPPGAPLTIPPDEAPDRMEDVTRTQALGTLTGYIAPANDADWYRFALTATTRLRITLADLPADFDVYIFDGSGQFLWASTWGRRLPEEIVARVPAGVYYVQLVGYAGAWSGEAPYRLSVEVVKGGGQGSPPVAEGEPGGVPVPW